MDGRTHVRMHVRTYVHVRMSVRKDGRTFETVFIRSTLSKSQIIKSNTLPVFSVHLPEHVGADVVCTVAAAVAALLTTYGWVIHACSPVLELPGEQGDFPHCGCGPHVIHGIKVSALSAPWCHPHPPPPTALVRPLMLSSERSGETPMLSPDRLCIDAHDSLRSLTSSYLQIECKVSSFMVIISGWLIIFEPTDMEYNSAVLKQCSSGRVGHSWNLKRLAGCRWPRGFPGHDVSDRMLAAINHKTEV